MLFIISLTSEPTYTVCFPNTFREIQYNIHIMFQTISGPMLENIIKKTPEDVQETHAGK
jgi:hypothetical protein